MNPTNADLQKALLRRANAKTRLDRMVEILTDEPTNSKKLRAVQEAAMEMADARSSYSKMLSRVTIGNEVEHDGA